ncbi:MAG TPA: phosphatase PAP2 family protein [Candidatus Fraserbacteria bacterium]|nr:phosphatase PAP2 family protein [Candidatus Fraserbacteria bacterium]
MDLLSWITAAFVQYGYWVVFLGVMLENAGIPLPGETILLAAAFFAYQGHFNLVIVIAVAAVGAVLGDNAGYWIGRRGGRSLLERYGGYLLLNAKRLAGLERFFERYGAKAVFFARFVTGFRVFTALFAGAGQMPWPKFVFYNAAGALIWSITMGSLGYLFGYSWEALAHWLGRGSLVAGAALLLIFALVWIRRRLPAWQRALDGWLPRTLGLRELLISFATLLSLGLFSKVAQDVAANESQRFDLTILQTIHRDLPAGWESLMKAITALGSFKNLGGLLIIILLVLLWRRRWRIARFLAVTGLLTPVFIEGLKLAFHRARPHLWPAPFEASYSFPSGHALGSLVIYGVLAYLVDKTWPRWRPAIWSVYLVLVLTIGFSRLYLGVHWPTDILGGWAAGGLLLFGLIYWREGRYRLPALVWLELRKLWNRVGTNSRS